MFTRAPDGGCANAPTETLARQTARVCAGSAPILSRRRTFEERRLALTHAHAHRRQPVPPAAPRSSDRPERLRSACLGLPPRRPDARRGAAVAPARVARRSRAVLATAALRCSPLRLARVRPRMLIPLGFAGGHARVRATPR